MKKTPRYMTIAQDIIELIQNGTLHSGDQLMTELQLCERYQVSRMTANKALSTLVTQGYISRTAGKGSFVLEPKVTKEINTSMPGSFTNDLASIGKKAGAILVEYRVIRAADSPLAMRQLRLEEQELLHYICRIRTSDGVRIALSHTHIPCKYLPSLDVTVLEGSLYEYLDKEHHIHPTVLTYTLNALLPNKQQQELLQLDSCALLKSSHVSTMDTGELFEYTETFYAGSRYTYRYSRIN